MRVDEVDCGGVRLAISRTGPGPDAPTFLFVNAVGMEWRLLSGLARGLADNGFNFVTWDLRGSPGPAADLNDCALPDHASDAVTILAKLGVSQAHIGGWCTGASVALFLAEQLGPRALSLTSVDGAYLFDGVPGAPLGNAMFAMCREIVADTGRGPYYHELTRPRGNEATVLGLDRAPELVDEVTLPYRQGIDELVRYAFAITAACAYDPRVMCGKVACPTLLTARLDDRMVSYRNSERAAALIPGSRIALTDSGGHYGLFTDSAVAVRDIAAFLRAVEESRAPYGAVTGRA